MSTCISWHGEYSEHEHGPGGIEDEFTCARCGVFDELAALAEIERLRCEVKTAIKAHR